MKFRSTAGAAPRVGFAEALLRGMPPDGGLYVPVRFPKLNLRRLAKLDFPALAYEVARKLKEVGIEYEFDRLKGWPHAMDIARPVNERCQWFMDRFFARHLKVPEK